MTKVNKAQELEDHIRELAERSKLDSWTSFVTELNVPSDMFPALASGRPELIALMQPRALIVGTNFVRSYCETMYAARWPLVVFGVSVQIIKVSTALYFGVN